MREYIIMTDSCADLSAAEVQTLDLTVVPLHYEMDGVEYTIVRQNDILAIVE